MSKKLSVVLGVLVVASMLLSACQPAAPEATAVLRGYDTSDIPSLDPQIAEDVTSINGIENIFVNLTNVDLNTSEVVPEAASSWEVSEDGLTYTFHIRTDIPWVKFDYATGETTQVTDADGNPRFVTAYDFEYAVARACNPATGGYYSGVIAPQIVGCSEVLFEEDPNAAIGAVAQDAETFVITLNFPAAYFLTMTPMWTLAATPQWAIEEHGDTWTEAENIVTNGRYVLADWQHGVRREFRRNPLIPADLAGAGNIGTLVTDVIPDDVTGYALWLNGEVEQSAIPDTELQAHLEQFPDETDQIADLAVFYISFAFDKAPFDDQRVRAAFSAAFDRETFVREVRQGQGLPMKHFAPPGIFGAPPIDEVGVGFNPEWAAEQLAAAGYPNCEGFPTVTLLGYTGASTLAWIEFAQANWEQNLGCSPDQIVIEQQEFADLLASTSRDTPTEERPHMWTLGWGPDYGDENNWVGDVLWCENSENRQARDCGEVDDLIVEARQETDPARRVELYSQIEEMFFGENGSFPFAPIFLRIAYTARHAWLTRTPALFGGQQYYNWTLDTELRDQMLAQ
jgi:oligopeptide transport system substrate-binding protein